MTGRLERAARDYAIALLAESTLNPSAFVLRDALRAVCDVPTGLTEVYWLVPTYNAPPGSWPVLPRILRARICLYLRLLRRAEAWERGEWWAVPPREDAHSSYHPKTSPEWSAKQHRPWKPLWTSAPAHDPSTTPAQRRASRESSRPT